MAAGSELILMPYSSFCSAEINLIRLLCSEHFTSTACSQFIDFSSCSGDASTIFVTKDGGVTWASVSAGLPAAAQGSNIRFHSISVGANSNAPTHLLYNRLVFSALKRTII